MKFIGTLLFICIPLLLEGHWDVEYWQDGRWAQYTHDPFTFYGTASIRFDEDVSRLYYYRATENLAYKACKNIDFEFHYSFIYAKQSDDESFTEEIRFLTRHRFEFEVNPHATLRNGTTIHMRNRLELIKRQHTNPLDKILRHRLQFVFPVKSRRLLSFECSDEIHYEINIGRFTQNRFIPLGVKIKMNQHLTILPYVMIRNFRTEGVWFRSIVFGSNLLF